MSRDSILPAEPRLEIHLIGNKNVKNMPAQSNIGQLLSKNCRFGIFKINRKCWKSSGQVTSVGRETKLPVQVKDPSLEHMSKCVDAVMFVLHSHFFPPPVFQLNTKCILQLLQVHSFYSKYMKILTNRIWILDSALRQNYFRKKRRIHLFYF